MVKLRNSILGIILMLISCDEKRVFDEYVSFENASWNKENELLFSFEVNDTITSKNLFINLRNNNDYEFSNLLMITKLNFPNGKKIIDTLEYEMANKTGKFLGSGFSDIKENKLFYKENIKFPMKGKYRVSIQQAMRRQGVVEGLKTLKGVTEVGFRIEKQ